MRKCKNCNNIVPYSAQINGIEKYFYNRKLCFDCSPYNPEKLPTTQLKALSNNSFKCILCDRIFTKDRAAGHRGIKCNGCLSAEEKRRKKQKCVDYKGGKCVVCKYSKNIKALVFHHIDPESKSFNIANSGLGFEKLKDELDKCVCLCHNCHVEVEDGKVNLNNYINNLA